MLISSSICHQGLVRDQNEDAILNSPKEGIFIVADGVGGNVGGHIASQLAVQTIERRLRQGDSLEAAFVSADMAISNAALQEDNLNGMASTAVALCFHGNDYRLGWVGDSRAYLVSSREITQLSSDHNVANELLKRGKISSSEARHHIGQHELTQALGQLSLKKIPVVDGRLNPGEMLLLCSDGLSGVLSEKTILHQLLKIHEIEDSLKTLLKQVLDKGAPDNISMILIKNVDECCKQEDRLKPVVNKRTKKTPPWVTGIVIVVVALVMLSMMWFD